MTNLISFHFHNLNFSSGLVFINEYNETQQLHSGLFPKKLPI